jgi:putative addiction module CopG family antidote
VVSLVEILREFESERSMQRLIDLTDPLNEFVEAEIARGEYANADEVVHDALRLLRNVTQSRQGNRDELDRMIREGAAELDAGLGVVIEGDEGLASFFEEMHTRVDERIAARRLK